MKNSVYKHAALPICMLSALLLFHSCDTEPVIVNKSAAEIAIVLSLVCPEKRGVEAYIGRSFPEVGITPLGNAKVEMAGGEQHRELTYHSGGLYRNEDFQAQHNLTYQISVLLNSGKLLLATTKVPGKIFIVNISHGDTLSYQKEPDTSKYAYYATGPRIAWCGGDRAAMYICFYQFEENILGQPTKIVATRDTSIRTFRLYFFNSTPGIDTKLVPIRKAKLIVCAIDSCFYKNGGYAYQEENSQLVLTGEKDMEIMLPVHNLAGWTNIANGTGVFGSYTYDAVDVVVELRQEQVEIANTIAK